jgi:YggT family protein
LISVGVAATPFKGGAQRLNMEAIRYIVDMLLWLLLLAFVLRLLFQLVRADFRDPMADAIVRVTNWLILPLRKLLPPIGKIDTATVVAVLLVAGARTFIIMALGVGGGTGDLLVFLRVTLLDLLGMVLRIYLFAMLLYWLTSFISPGGYAPGVRLLGQLCEPILKRVRSIIPPIAQIDFSFLWVSIAIGALLVLLR